MAHSIPTSSPLHIFIYMYTHTISLPFASPSVSLCQPPPPPKSPVKMAAEKKKEKKRRRSRRKGPLCNFGLKVKDNDGNQWINYLRVGWQNGMMVTAGACRSCLAMRNFKQVVVVQRTNLKQTQWHTHTHTNVKDVVHKLYSLINDNG